MGTYCARLRTDKDTYLSNLLQFPKITPQRTTDCSSDISVPNSDRVKLFEGKLVLHRRSEQSKGIWQYSIQTPEGWERRSTKAADLEEVKKVAIARYEEIKFRVSRKLSVKATTFEAAAKAYLARLERQAELGGKNSTVEKQGKLIHTHMVPFFGTSCSGAQS